MSRETRPAKAKTKGKRPAARNSGKSGTAQRRQLEKLLAAHLEAHTKVLGKPILIDENTRSGLSERVRVESHGPAQFKTRSQPAQVYSVPPGQRP